MKFYLASSFSLIEYVKGVAETLAKVGHEVTQEWWKFDFKSLPMPDHEWYRDVRVRQISLKNFAAIDEADALIMVCHPTEARKFNGANVELGYALAKGKKCYAIGRLERSAMYVPVEQLYYSDLLFKFRGVEYL